MLEEAFPAALRPEVLAATRAAPVTGSGAIAVVVRGERLNIPYRVQADAARLEAEPALQREVLSCILSRHLDGHVRERALRRIVRSPSDWVVPFVVQLAGEYVLEIHRVIEDALPFLDGALYAAFLRENPVYYERTRARVVSYWNCYYRRDPAYAGRTRYPAFKVLEHLDALLRR